MTGQLPGSNGTVFSRPLAVLDSVLQWMIRLVWLNLWWLALTLLGGVLLGFGPATAAGHTVVTRWLRGETDLSVPRTMWHEWRRDWGRRVLVSLIGVGLTASLALAWWLAGQQALVPGAITRALATVGLILMAATLPHLAWVTERTDLNTGRTVLAALAAGLGRPILTVSLLVVGLGWPTLLVATEWPGLLPLGGTSVPLLAGAWCIERVFPSRSTTDDPANDGPGTHKDSPTAGATAAPGPVPIRKD